MQIALLSRHLRAGKEESKTRSRLEQLQKLALWKLSVKRDYKMPHYPGNSQLHCYDNKRAFFRLQINCDKCKFVNSISESNMLSLKRKHCDGWKTASEQVKQVQIIYIITIDLLATH